MREDYLNNIVAKNYDLEIFPFDSQKDQYLVTIKSLNHRIKINQNTKDIIDLIDNQSSFKKIIDNYNKTHENVIDIKTAYKLIYEKLVIEGIVLIKDYKFKIPRLV